MRIYRVGSEEQASAAGTMPAPACTSLTAERGGR